jgi:hypothetical protein
MMRGRGCSACHPEAGPALARGKRGQEVVAGTGLRPACRRQGSAFRFLLRSSGLRYILAAGFRTDAAERPEPFRHECALSCILACHPEPSRGVCEWG